jgi:inhibitor of cysteine peptidase
MNRIVLALGLAFLALSIAGCQAGQVKITEADNGGTVTIKAGDELILDIAGNPTTGYVWSVTGLDEAYLQQQGEENYKRDSDLIGAGGMYTYTFKALQPCQTTLTLSYARPFEQDTPPVKTFSVEVLIK